MGIMHRVTTNGMLHIYRANLQNSYKTLSTAMQKVQTGRNFLSYAEDPASATLAFKLRREHWQANCQLRNNNSILSNFSQAFNSYDLVKNNLANQTVEVNALRGLNDPNGTARKTLAQSTLEAAESAVQTLNVQYGGRFLFAGADGMNAPFTIEEREVMQADGTKLMKMDTTTDPPTPTDEPVLQKQLCYRGIPVNQPEKIVKLDAAGNQVTDPATGEPVMEPNPEYQKLKGMLEEATYVDIGLGMQENPDGTPIKSTVYNSALSGLEYLDFGYDEDGDPKNAISIMLGIHHHLDGASDMDGKWHKEDDGTYTNDSPSYERLFEMTKKLEVARKKMDVEFTELSTKASFLTNNGKRLETEIDELETQIVGVEDIDPVAAITTLSWAQYCYNAGLKIGNSILSQSLIDYMN